MTQISNVLIAKNYLMYLEEDIIVENAVKQYVLIVVLIYNLSQDIKINKSEYAIYVIYKILNDKYKLKIC